MNDIYIETLRALEEEECKKEALAFMQLSDEERFVEMIMQDLEYIPEKDHDTYINGIMVTYFPEHFMTESEAIEQLQREGHDTSKGVAELYRKGLIKY